MKEQRVDEMTPGELAVVALMCASVILGGLVGWVSVGNVVAALGGAAIWGAAALCLVILVPLAFAVVARLFAWLVRRSE